MTTLDDDIARIAALRGQAPAEMVAKAHEPRYPTRHEVDQILRPPLGPSDIDACDALPPKSRRFIRECDRPLNATAWLYLLRDTGNEDEIIKAVTFCLAN